MCFRAFGGSSGTEERRVDEKLCVKKRKIDSKGVTKINKISSIIVTPRLKNLVVCKIVMPHLSLKICISNNSKGDCDKAPKQVAPLSALYILETTKSISRYNECTCTYKQKLPLYMHVCIALSWRNS